jgi:hypothetical protein
MNKIVPVPFAHDDLAGLFTGSDASDIENPARDVNGGGKLGHMAAG